MLREQFELKIIRLINLVDNHQINNHVLFVMNRILVQLCTIGISDIYKHIQQRIHRQLLLAKMSYTKKYYGAAKKYLHCIIKELKIYNDILKKRLIRSNCEKDLGYLYYLPIGIREHIDIML